MAIKYGAPSDRLVTDRFEIKEIHNLLTEGQYEKLAALLLQLQLVCRENEDRVLADILTATHRICLACNQCRDEAASLSRACTAAEMRENELKNELHDILGLVINGRVPETEPKLAALQLPNLPAPNRSEYNLWQRVQSVLGWRKTPDASNQIVPTETYSPLINAIDTEVKTLPDLASESRTGVWDTLSVEQEEQRNRKSLSLIIYCLGPFRVYNNDRLVEKWPGQKCKSLFKYMVVNHT